VQLMWRTAGLHRLRLSGALDSGSDVPKYPKMVDFHGICLTTMVNSLDFYRFYRCLMGS
jgi:hypothetical protein